MKELVEGQINPFHATRGFLMFSEGIERGKRNEMG